MRTVARSVLPLACIAALALTACGTSSAPAGDAMTSAASSSSSAASSSATSAAGSSATSGVAAARPGAYIDYAAYAASPSMYAGSKVVLFFHAPWCPNCRESEKSLTTDGVPDGLTVVKVDYDSMTDLKKKHGVTYQHTFVLVDDAGNTVRKFVATTGKDIATEVA